MKLITLVLVAGILLLNTKIEGQMVQGEIIDSETHKPLVFANVGVIDIARGTISNQQGAFKLDCSNLEENSRILFSMIGYEAKAVPLSELLGKQSVIALKQKPLKINQVSVEYKGIKRIIGNEKSPLTRKVCGWGGTDYAKGHEMGLILDFGKNKVHLQDLNMKVSKQSFDKVLLRLHIRSLTQDGYPGEELLLDNIYMTISEPKGWQKFDFSEYEIFVQDSVFLAIECIKVEGINEKNLVRIGESREPRPNVLFDFNPNRGSLFLRRGSSAKWRKSDPGSPMFYVTISE